MRHHAANRPSSAIAALALGFLILGSGVGVRAGGQEPAIAAAAKCDPVPGPGKIHCTVRARPIGGKFSWGDVIVLSAPRFAPPLRTRLAAGDASRSDAEGADFELALAATGDGSGELRVRTRAVVCGDGGCRPVMADVSARVTVGAEGPSR
jgi:hypothetical protein